MLVPVKLLQKLLRMESQLAQEMNPNAVLMTDEPIAVLNDQYFIFAVSHPWKQ